MTPFVYLALGADGTHKIGWTRDVAQRMQNLASEARQAVRLLHFVQTEHATWIEGYLHCLFQGKRLHGEWFNLSSDEIAYVRTLTPEAIVALHQQAPGTESVRVEKDLARKLTMIAIKQGVSVSEILSPRIRDWVEKLYRDMVRKMNAELDED